MRPDAHFGAGGSIPEVTSAWTDRIFAGGRANILKIIWMIRMNKHLISSIPVEDRPTDIGNDAQTRIPEKAIVNFERA
jgi:hypothetical protein